jgi:hypothetical protein
VVLAVAGALVLVLAAGGWFFFLRTDAREQYCTDLRAWDAASKEAAPAEAANDPAVLAEFTAGRIASRIADAEDFADNAPDDLGASWKVFAVRLQDIVDTVETALGYDLTDPQAMQQFLTDVQSGAVNPSDPAIQPQLAAVQARAADAEAVAAISAITKDAQSECSVEISLSTSTPAQ